MKRVVYVLSLLIFCLSAYYSVSADSIDQYNVCVPAVMYHEIVDDEQNENEYAVTKSQIENDFASYKEMGFTPITISDYVKLTEAYTDAQIPGENGEKALIWLQGFLAEYPNPMLITFDDGYDDGYEILLPLLKKYGYKANIAVVGKYSAGGGVFLNSEELKEMADSGYVEFGNHTYSLHNLSFEEISLLYSDIQNKQRISDDYNENEIYIRNATGKKPGYFAYPYGVFSDVTEAILDEMGVRVSLATSISSDFVRLDNSTRKIARINRAAYFDSKEFVDLIVNRIKKQAPGVHTSIEQNTCIQPPEGSVPVYAEFNNGIEIYKFQVYEKNNILFIMKDELAGIRGVSINEENEEKTVIDFDGNKIVWDKERGRILSKNNMNNVGHLENGCYPFKELFENQGYILNFNSYEKTVTVCKKYKY